MISIKPWFKDRFYYIKCPSGYTNSFIPEDITENSLSDLIASEKFYLE
jgi:hypothetical protein